MGAGKGPNARPGVYTEKYRDGVARAFPGAYKLKWRIELEQAEAGKQRKQGQKR